MTAVKVAIFDDYQGVALECADWGRLDAEVVVFTDHILDVDELVRMLAGFEVVVAMRERTWFTAEVLRRLPDLRLLVSTGPRNVAIDVAAAARQGIVVSGTGYFGEPTAELTWGCCHVVGLQVLDGASWSGGARGPGLWSGRGGPAGSLGDLVPD
ncbi:hypothetical protein ACFRQM_52130, partial [Streptomyces sp. NPDC056831]